MVIQLSLTKQPELQRHGQQPIPLPKLHHAAGIVMLWELAPEQSIAQRPDFIAIEIAHRITKLLGRGVGTRNQAVRGEAVEHFLVIRVHVDTFSLTFTAPFSRTSAKMRCTKTANAHSSLDKEKLWLMIRTWMSTTTVC